MVIFALLVWSIIVVGFMYAWPSIADHMEDTNPHTIPSDPVIPTDDKTSSKEDTVVM